MEGPTPVSALIHSSTIVTAGCILFNKIYFLSKIKNKKIIFIFGIFTLFFATISGFYSFDLKNMLANSTICQISTFFLIIYESSKSNFLPNFFGHSFYKSFSFLVVGLCIISNKDIQDYRRSKFFMSKLFLLFGAVPVSMQLSLPFTFLHSEKSLYIKYNIFIYNILICCILINNTILIIVGTNIFYSRFKIIKNKTHIYFNNIIFLIFFIPSFLLFFQNFKKINFPYISYVKCDYIYFSELSHKNMFLTQSIISLIFLSIYLIIINNKPNYKCINLISTFTFHLDKYFFLSKRISMINKLPLIIEKIIFL